MHGAVIFRMKGKCTLLERALSRLQIYNSILDHRNSRLDALDARLDPPKFRESRIESRVSRIETRVTVNLLLSGTLYVTLEINPYTNRRVFVCGLSRDGTSHGTSESHSCTFPLGRPVSRKAGK